MLNYLKIDFKYGSTVDISNSKIIYSPVEPIDLNTYYDTEKIFIFGPHFSVFPTYKLKNINVKAENVFYIQPSQWALDVWNAYNLNISLKVIPFPVNIEKFNENNHKIKDKVFVYYKRRNPAELAYLVDFLRTKNISFKLFDYLKGYDENEYLDYLQSSKYGIILDAHESQGFALEEAMSCNVPLLVWTVTKLNQEYGSNYPPYDAITVPYWDNRCGEIFYNDYQLEKTFNKFMSDIENYNPREYVIQNLSTIACSKILEELIKL
jgi:hypothetical protein